MTMTKDQIRAAQRIGLEVLNAIDTAGELGAPSGVLYAALMTQGCTLNQYQSLMGSMERPGFVKQENDCYFLTETGREFKAKLAAVVEPVAA